MGTEEPETLEAIDKIEFCENLLMFLVGNVFKEQLKDFRMHLETSTFLEENLDSEEDTNILKGIF